MKKEGIILIGLSICVFFLFFWQTVVKGTFPFPGNFFIAWNEPWKSDNISNGVITLAHKPVAEDVFRMIFPFKILAIEQIKNFEIPLWNPYNGSGTPFLAAINNGYLDPFNILFLFLPYYVAWTAIIVLQVQCIAAFTYAYCRSLRLGVAASLFGSLVYLFSGVVVARTPFTVYNLGFAILPLSLFIIEKYLQTGKRTYIFFLAPVIGILMLSTHPQYCVYIIGFFLAYTIVRFFQAGKRKIQEYFPPFLSVFLGFGLAAVQLVPALELHKFSNLTYESSSFVFGRFLLPLEHLLTIVIPNYFGNPATYNYWGGNDYIETAVSLGLIPIFFVFLTLFHRQKEGKPYLLLKKFLIFVSVTSVLLTLKLPVIQLIYTLNIPLLSIGVPSRIFILTVFSLSVLSGVGFESWMNRKEESKRIGSKLAVYGIFTALIIGAAYWVYTTYPLCPAPITQCHMVSLRNTLLESGVFAIVAALIVVSFIPLRGIKKARNIFPGIVILILALSGAYNAYKFLPFSSKSTFFPQNELIDAIHTKVQQERVFGFGSANIRTDFATYFHFYDPQYYHPLYIKHYGELVSYANTGKIGSELQRSDVEIINESTVSAQVQFRRERLLSLLGVKYFIFDKSEVPNPPGSTVWENSKWYLKDNAAALPRAFLVGKTEIVPDRNATLETLFSQSFDPATTVLLDIGEPLTEQMSPEDSVEITSYRENSVVLKTKASGKRILVLSDSHFPGWKASIDGRTAPILRADYSFRAVVLPPGNHTVTFTYEPSSLKVGILISVVSAMVLFILYKTGYLKR